ncbi:hypothetical protein F503_08607 [Ophiostoma piceae UAMH 11346]|uniref:Uncharacterized protein n=1 Tax=Ophiostoma piceae (strain UAMH 11346) TaxID=1262450 RepID=S3CNZ4_OPHP1|nr:hypothetical protein F503_08607 [Ophiostoma piceae UAMH 11346]
MADAEAATAATRASAAVAAAAATGATAEGSADTVGSLLAAIATALQDAQRILVFADKRGWGPDEFEQLRTVEDALEEARQDFQALGPLVNGQFYYENDRRIESLRELQALREMFDDHTQLFRDWLRTGGAINPLWVRETVALRRQLHRAQCRAARRIFNSEHETGDGSGSGTRCLGAFLVYRRFREHEELRKRYARGDYGSNYSQNHGHSQNQRENSARAGHTAQRTPTWKLQQPQLQAREQRRFVGQEPFRGRNGHPEESGDTTSIEMTPQNGFAKPPTHSPHTATPQTVPFKYPAQKNSHISYAPHSPYTPSHLQAQKSPATATVASVDVHTRIPLRPDEPPTPPPRPPTLEDLVPECKKVGTFERFGDRDIAFICDFCDGHIVWEDVQRLPTMRVPPAAISSADAHLASRLPPSIAVSPAFGTPLPTSSISPGMALTASGSAAATPAPLLLQNRLSPSPTPFRGQSPVGSRQGSSSPSATSASTYLPPEAGEDEYPRWQATTVAVSDANTQRTVVFAPLAIANHLPPMAGDWEARLWCPYCDDYMYYDSAEGDQTKYAQEEGGFQSLDDFQAHLEWHHTALPVPAMPALPTSSSCVVM